MTNLRDVTYIFISSTSDIDMLRRMRKLPERRNIMNGAFHYSHSRYVEERKSRVMINKAITRTRPVLRNMLIV